MVEKIALIAVLGIGAQWLAWRLHLPAIVLMALAGLAAGPGFGLIDPARDFGELLRPMVSLAVAVILFEGGLNLNLHELKIASTPVRRLIFLGAPISWGLGTAAAHWIAGLSWPVAVLFGGVLVVTGPTVIMPLLRQAKLAPRVGAVLKWEGIVNDPIGALLAVLVFELVSAAPEGRSVVETAGQILIGSLIAVIIGILLGRAIIWLFSRGWVPEFLKAAVLLSAVIGGFTVASLVQHEGGLVTVTVFGMTLANARFASLDAMRRFKEDITVVLVSGLFIVLTASLTPAMMLALDWRALAFVLAILFVVRPATVWLSTIGAGLSWQERSMIGWIAPRGIVAVAVTGYFGPALGDLGYADADALAPLAFAIVFATVIAHGFSIGWLGRRLGLSATGRPGVLIVGGSDWSVGLAKVLEDLETPTTVADNAWSHLRGARLAGLPVFFGEILSEQAEFRLDLNRFGYVLALTDNPAYNALVCQRFGAEVGRHRVFQLGLRDDDDRGSRGFAFTIGGQTLFQTDVDFYELLAHRNSGWTFTKTRLTDEYDLDSYRSRPAGGDDDGGDRPAQRRVRVQRPPRPAIGEAGRRGHQLRPPRGPLESAGIAVALDLAYIRTGQPSERSARCFSHSFSS